MATHPADITADHRLSSMEVLAYAAAYLADDDDAFPGVGTSGRAAYVLRAAAIYQANLLSRYEDIGTPHPQGSAEHAQRWEGRGDSWVAAPTSPTYRTYHMTNGTLGWPVLTEEMDAGRPMVFLVDTDADGVTDHFVTVIGYREDPRRQYACLDTWDTAIHWYDFAEIAPGQPWGVWGGWAFGIGGGSLAAQGMASGPPPADAQSRTGPTPPDRPAEARGGAGTIIEGVTAHLWRHGCGPTALGMVIGHWAAGGFPHLDPGSMQQAIASGDGPGTHYSDYAEPLDYWPSLLADKSESGGAHAHDCLADFMRCSWSGRDNRYGWSWASDMGPAFVAYANMRESQLPL